MKSVIRFEVHRMVGSWGFRIALALGLIIAVLQVCFVSIPFAYGDIWSNWRNGASGTYPPSFYNVWMGLTSYSVFTGIFYHTVPFLACMAYADSFCWDIHQGYAAEIVSRVGRRRYFTAKALVVTAAAAIVVLVPLVVNIVGTACFVPAYWPEASTKMFFVSSSNMLADLYYEAPGAFIAVFVAFAVACGMLCALIACVASFWIENRFVVVLLPFALCYFLQFMVNGTFLAGFVPFNAITPYQPAVSNVFVVLAIGAVLLAVTAGCIKVRSKRWEGL